MEKLKKRDRAVNFSQEETDELLKQVVLKKSIIENKKSDSKTWQEKESAWKSIEFAFNNAIGGHFRDSKHLKIKYEAIKRDTRKKVAYLRTERYKTNGRSNNAPQLTPTEVKVKEVILDLVEGTESVYDSDSKDEVLIEIAGPSNSLNDTIIQIPDTSNKEIQLKNDDLVMQMPESSNKHVQKKIKRVEIVADDFQEKGPNLLKSNKYSGTCNEKKKSNFKKLIEVQLEVAFLQKRLVEEDLEIKAMQKKILEDDLEQKRQIFQLEKQNLLLQNQNLKNKTG